MGMILSKLNLSLFFGLGLTTAPIPALPEDVNDIVMFRENVRKQIDKYAKSIQFNVCDFDKTKKLDEDRYIVNPTFAKFVDDKDNSNSFFKAEVNGGKVIYTINLTGKNESPQIVIPPVDPAAPPAITQVLRFILLDLLPPQKAGALAPVISFDKKVMTLFNDQDEGMIKSLASSYCQFTLLDTSNPITIIFDYSKYFKFKAGSDSYGPVYSYSTLDGPTTDFSKTYIIGTTIDNPPGTDELATAFKLVYGRLANADAVQARLIQLEVDTFLGLVGSFTSRLPSSEQIASLTRVNTLIKNEHLRNEIALMECSVQDTCTCNAEDKHDVVNSCIDRSMVHTASAAVYLACSDPTSGSGKNIHNFQNMICAKDKYTTPHIYAFMLKLLVLKYSDDKEFANMHLIKYLKGMSHPYFDGFSQCDNLVELIIASGCESSHDLLDVFGADHMVSVGVGARSLTEEHVEEPMVLTESEASPVSRSSGSGKKPANNNRVVVVVVVIVSVCAAAGAAVYFVI